MIKRHLSLDKKMFHEYIKNYYVLKFNKYNRRLPFKVSKDFNYLESNYSHKWKNAIAETYEYIEFLPYDDEIPEEERWEHELYLYSEIDSFIRSWKKERVDRVYHNNKAINMLRDANHVFDEGKIENRLRLEHNFKRRYRVLEQRIKYEMGQVPVDKTLLKDLWKQMRQSFVSYRSYWGHKQNPWQMSLTKYKPLIPSIFTDLDRYKGIKFKAYATTIRWRRYSRKLKAQAFKNDRNYCNLSRKKKVKKINTKIFDYYNEKITI